MLKVYHEIAHPVAFDEVSACGVATGSEGGDYRPQWKWCEPWSRSRCCGEGDGRGWLQTGGSYDFVKPDKEDYLADLQLK